MSVEKDSLFIQVKDQIKNYEKAAAHHKRLNRILWGLSSLVSIIVAISANLKFTLFGISSNHITSIFAILAPVVTGYVILRSPESLWVLEIDMRNRLRDLQKKIEFSYEKSPGYNRETLEKEYFAIMGEANKKWRELKENQGNS